MEIIDKALSTTNKLPKYEQFAHVLLEKINDGELKNGDRLPSIVDSSLSYGLSRDTVLRAYKELYKLGTITSIYRKGYFVSNEHPNAPSKKVLIILNEMTSANYPFYQRLTATMEENLIQCDFKFYRNDSNRLNSIIKESTGNYHHYIAESQILSTEKLMELFNNKISRNEVIIINDEQASKCVSGRNVFIDIEKSFYTSLTKLSPQINRYSTLNLVLPEQEYFPYKLINTFFDFCDKKHKAANLLDEIGDVVPGNVYILIDEKSLFRILGNACVQQLELGVEIGVLTLFDRDYLQYLTKKITSINWFNQSLIEYLISFLKNEETSSALLDAELNIGESL